MEMRGLKRRMSELERKEEQRWRQEKRQREEQELRLEVERKIREERINENQHAAQRYSPFPHGCWPRP